MRKRRTLRCKYHVNNVNGAPFKALQSEWLLELFKGITEYDTCRKRNAIYKHTAFDCDALDLLSSYRHVGS